mmetsp:Transcript_43268/g.87501  ORF Transcript_43268/g.87501 Transcript_43268/m.87501 type:complete len:270 (-) Transcript_43268:128-937(-)
MALRVILESTFRSSLNSNCFNGAPAMMRSVQGVRLLATLGGAAPPAAVNHERRKLSLSPAELIREKREVSRRSWKNFGRKRAELPNPFAPALPRPEVAISDEKFVVRQVSQTYKNVSYSPLRMNVVAKLLRRQTVLEALAQATLTPKKGGAATEALIESVARRAAEKYGLPHEALRVDHLIVNQGPGKKRVKFMGRGRTGLKFIRSCHITVTLGEIDFDKYIVGAVNAHDANNWARLKEEAADATQALVTSTAAAASAKKAEAEAAKAA